MKKWIVGFVCLCFNYIYAQQQRLAVAPTTGDKWGDVEYENRKLDDMYSLVDKTKITSGFFVNRGFYGTEIPVVTEIKTYKDVDNFYTSLRKAYVGSGPNPIKPYLEWQDTLASFRKASTKIGLSLFTVDMHAVKSTAYNDGTVYFDQNQRLIVSNPSTAYKVVYLCTTVPSAFNLTGSAFQFIMPSKLAVSNNTSTSAQIKTEIDFSDNLGYRPITKEQTLSVTYSSGGLKTVKVRYKLGTTTLGESTFDLNITLQNQLRTVTGYSDIFSVTVNKDRWEPTSLFQSWPNESKKLYMSQVTGAKVYEYLGCDGVRDKYCIIVEGFDANNEITAEDVLHRGSVYYTEPIGKMFRDLLADGYEVVFVDFNSGGDYIENNSAVLEKVIETVNLRKGTNIPNIVIGVSMGGLLTRHTLRQMEIKGKDHQTALANYFDTPHLGANVPVGYQLLTYQLLSYPSFIDKLTLGVIGALEEVRKTNHSQTCPAARQMLVRYLGSSPDSYFTNFQQILANEGLPQKCRNISIVNGSNNGTSQAFSPGSNLYNKTMGIGLSFDVWASYNGGTNMVCRIKEKIRVEFQVVDAGCLIGLFGVRFGCWNRVSIGFTLLEQDLYSYSGYFDKCYDNSPGSTQDDITTAFEDNLGGSFPAGEGHFTFIPSVSSSYLKPTYSSNLNYNLQNVDFQQASYLNKVYSYQSINGPHIFDKSPYLGSSFSLIRINEIMASNLYVQNKSFNYNTDLVALKTITIGNNVTANFSVGNVNFEIGKYNIKAGGYVLIQPGTVIKSGSDVKISIDSYLLAANNNCTISLRQETSESSLSFEEINEDNSSLKATTYYSYPNPIHTGLLKFSRHVESYELIDITGIVVKQGVDSDRLDVTGLSKGIYLLKLDDKVEKIVVE